VLGVKRTVWEKPGVFAEKKKKKSLGLGRTCYLDVEQKAIIAFSIGTQDGHHTNSAGGQNKKKGVRTSPENEPKSRNRKGTEPSRQGEMYSFSPQDCERPFYLGRKRRKGRFYHRANLKLLLKEKGRQRCRSAEGGEERLYSTPENLREEKAGSRIGNLSRKHDPPLWRKKIFGRLWMGEGKKSST